MSLPTIFDIGPYSKDFLGGKGFGLWQMQQAGINVPPAIIIPTDSCVAYMKDPKGTLEQVKQFLPEIQAFFIDRFGYMPLLSVRSGAKDSLPGMMDTILNVGLDSVTYAFWDEKLGAACASNCAKRLEEMYSETVLGLPKGTFGVVPSAEKQLINCIEAVFNSWNSERAKIYRKLNKISDDGGTAVTIQAMVFGNFNEKSGSGVLFSRD